jgi:hypothetical protein
LAVDRARILVCGVCRSGDAAALDHSVIALGENGGMNGGAHFTLTDGATGDFIFGAAAAKV